MTTSTHIAPSGRAELVRRATLLNRLTIGWNAVEAVLAIAAGITASSIGLIAFGLDSTIEVSAALILAWPLYQERQQGCQLENDDRARVLIGWSFVALAAYVGVSAIIDLAGRHEPEVSRIGIAIAALSLIAMPVLATAKKRVAIQLGSQAAVAEADQTNVCTMLSAALLVGLLANAVAGWWWADPLAGLAIAAVSLWMAWRTFQADELEHACCG